MGLFRLEIIKRHSFSVNGKGLSRLTEDLAKSIPSNSKLKLVNRMKAVSLGVIFVGKGDSQKLNAAYRGKNYPTDVLSFEGALHIPGPSLGELVFCVPVLKRQAQEHGLTLDHEFKYLFIHGFLHLLGYDHEASPAQEKRMMKLQDHLFESLVLATESS